MNVTRLQLRNFKRFTELEKTRNSYEIIKTFSRELKARAVNEITTATAADDFEEFYRFLNMKSHRPNGYLAGFDLRPADLAATRWMRDAIARIVDPSLRLAPGTTDQ